MARAERKIKMKDLIKFEINPIYSTPSICDSNCIFKFRVIKRTEKNVWISQEGSTKVTRRKIDIWDGAENIFPFGKYSMAPILSATDKQK